jgi:hypothetical protein
MPEEYAFPYQGFSGEPGEDAVKILLFPTLMPGISITDFEGVFVTSRGEEMAREHLGVGDPPVCPIDKMREFERLYDGRFVPFFSNREREEGA